jgi:hypothetical protein
VKEVQKFTGEIIAKRQKLLVDSISYLKYFRYYFYTKKGQVYKIQEFIYFMSENVELAVGLKHKRCDMHAAEIQINMC